MITKFHIFESNNKKRGLFYHATKSENLPSIVKYGLTPNNKTNWETYSDWCKGKVFVTDLKSSTHYSNHINQNKNFHSILRIWIDPKQLTEDDYGDYYSEEPIKGEFEIYNGEEWVKLTSKLAKHIANGGWDDRNINNILLNYEKYNQIEYIYEGLTMSAPPKKAMKILKRKFPDYYIGFRFASDQGEIEISAGRKEYVDEIKKIEDICRVIGWFISHGVINYNTFKYDNEFIEHSYDEVIIKQKFDSKDVLGTPSILYHVTPKKNVPKILKIGLVPKHKDKLVHHPDRIYLTDDLELAWGLKKEFERINGDECEILKVNMKGLNIKLYSDVDLRSSGYYTMENIHPKFISILPENEYRKHWSWNVEPFTGKKIQENYDFVIKDINLFDKTQTENVRKPSHRLMSWDEIYKTHKGIKWCDYENGFDSIQDYFKKFFDDTN